MKPPVLLLLLMLIVRCGGCNDFLKGAVGKLKETINTNHAGFREVFPIDYKISHHYDGSLLCSDSCCVYRSAAVLSDSWNQLLKKLWPVNHKFKIIEELSDALDKIAKMRLQEEPDVTILPHRSSVPEDLLNYTSVLFSAYLKLDPHCSTSEGKCLFLTETPPIEAEEQEQPPSRHRLLTTRNVRQEREGERENMFDYTHPLSNGDQSCVRFPGLLAYSCHLGTLLLCGHFYWRLF